MGYEHETAVEAAPEPEVIVTEPSTNENDVKIAEAEAAARVAETKVYAQNRDPELEAENARLRGEIEGMRTAMANLSPPEPVSEPETPPEPEVIVAEPEHEPTPPENSGPPEPKTKKRPGFWDAYR
jgi:hypothetical protein